MATTTTTTVAVKRSGWRRLFQTTFSRSQNPMLLSDDERRIIDVNPAFARMLATRRSELLGKHLWDLVEGGALMTREQWLVTISRDEVTGHADLVRGDGVVVRTQFGVHPAAFGDRKLVLFVALVVPRWGRQHRRSVRAVPPGRLTARERQVLDLVAMGATSPEIAETLHISDHTVRKHVDSAMRKMGARSRAHLVAKALAEGAIHAPEQAA